MAFARSSGVVAAKGIEGKIVQKNNVGFVHKNTIAFRKRWLTFKTKAKG
jgi:hypothetical protein